MQRIQKGRGRMIKLVYLFPAINVLFLAVSPTDTCGLTHFISNDKVSSRFRFFFRGDRGWFGLNNLTWITLLQAIFMENILTINQVHTYISIYSKKRINCLHWRWSQRFQSKCPYYMEWCTSIGTNDIYSKNVLEVRR